MKRNKMRYSDEQIKALQTMFESSKRLKLRRKIQIARELGLKPRQVAIWFQNRRARCKSKEVEREFNALQADYNDLVSKLEALEKEKEALLLKIQKLNDEMKQLRANEKCYGDDNVERNSNKNNNTTGELNTNVENREKTESEVNPSLSIETSNHVPDGAPKLMAMAELANRSLTSLDDWGSFGSDGLFDQSNSDSQWWDLWG